METGHDWGSGYQLGWELSRCVRRRRGRPVAGRGLGGWLQDELEEAELGAAGRTRPREAFRFGEALWKGVLRPWWWKWQRDCERDEVAYLFFESWKRHERPAFSLFADSKH